MSHVSVNFDRTGFQRDLNVVLPRDRLDELVASGKIGGVAPEHYSFMGGDRGGEARARGERARREAACRAGRHGAAVAGLTRVHLRRERNRTLPGG